MTSSRRVAAARRHNAWSHPTDSGARRRGIGATPTFRSFRDASSVVIWITHFDIGGDITARDIELAEYLMGVYRPYEKVADRP